MAKDTNLTVTKLAAQLKASGWDKSEKTLIYAARYYKGLETVETLQKCLPASDINYILHNR